MMMMMVLMMVRVDTEVLQPFFVSSNWQSLCSLSS
jgi:hypothetical protein